MRLRTSIAALLPLLATTVLPALSLPIEITAEDRMMRRTLSPAERHELLLAKRIILDECTGPVETWPQECFNLVPGSSPYHQTRNEKRILCTEQNMAVDERRLPEINGHRLAEFRKRLICSGEADCGEPKTLDSIRINEYVKRLVIFNQNRGCFRRPQNLAAGETLAANPDVNTTPKLGGLRLMEYVKRMVDLRCSGDPNTLPADCFNKNFEQPPTLPNGHHFYNLAVRPPSPASEPPASEPPASVPHATASPATVPPATEPPTTVSPTTVSPTTVPPATEPPATVPPATEPPATVPPATEPPAIVPPATALATAPVATPATTTAAGNQELYETDSFYV
ncbi:hypothetical protein BC835DRAFT_94070 [Cytidiella melzeri]|nr:hypothetical protein BC835DRAFT_94070 [Cytidiella melzeri]